jgi:hypothetical protein
MPLFQYFGWVGSFLLAALLAANWCFPAPVTPQSDVPLDQKISIRLVWGFHCQGGVTPFWSSFAFHSFVRPAPRAFFRPDRIFPLPSRAAAVKDGASLAPPKACP